MARPRNAFATKEVGIRTTPQIWKVLNLLTRTGRFGKNPSEVAEELLRAKVRDVELEGWLGNASLVSRRRGPVGEAAAERHRSLACSVRRRTGPVASFRPRGGVI
jgi:hypothetical protein